jgi:hypothetical protein
MARPVAPRGSYLHSKHHSKQSIAKQYQQSLAMAPDSKREFVDTPSEAVQQRGDLLGGLTTVDSDGRLSLASFPADEPVHTDMPGLKNRSPADLFEETPPTGVEPL